MKKKTKNNSLYESQKQAVLKVLDYYFHDLTKCIDWLYTRNPLLGNVVPNDMLLAGRFDKLQKFIYERLEENEK